MQDVFYTDLRDPSAIDLTKPIMDWLRNSKEEAQKKWECIVNGELQLKQKAVVGEASVSHMPRFSSIEMQKIRFCDLSFRLGAGYLYCHQVPSFFCRGFIVWLLPFLCFFSSFKLSFKWETCLIVIEKEVLLRFCYVSIAQCLSREKGKNFSLVWCKNRMVIVQCLFGLFCLVPSFLVELKYFTFLTLCRVLFYF